MGQYYLVVNIDKREVLAADEKLIAGKLLEIAESKEKSCALMNMLAEPWKGNRVYLAGDYTDLKKENTSYHRVLSELTDSLQLKSSFGGVYKYAKENFTKVKADTKDHGYRFIYNHKAKQYIDILHCPKCCAETDWRQGFISPLPLLIALGNGEGSGDYYNCDNDNLPGTWCESVTSLEITVEPKDELEYVEWKPNFTYPKGEWIDHMKSYFYRRKKWRWN